MKRPAIIISALVFALLIAGGAFWGGMNLGKAQAQDEQNSFFRNRGVDPNNLPAGAVPLNDGQGAGGFIGGAGGPGAGGTGGQGGFRGQRAGAFGKITKVDGNTLTITDNQGKDVTVTITNNTPIVKSVQGTKDDLKVGTNIIVRGDRSGNNVAATGIQISDQPPGVGNIFGRPPMTPTPTK